MHKKLLLLAKAMLVGGLFTYALASENPCIQNRTILHK